jgi:ATP-dependent helicase/nuclease subunit A
MLAYGLTLFQHDPARQVRASLWFADLDVEERVEGQRSELTDIESELRSMLDLVP